MSKATRLFVWLIYFTVLFGFIYIYVSNSEKRKAPVQQKQVVSALSDIPTCTSKSVGLCVEREKIVEVVEEKEFAVQEIRIIQEPAEPIVMMPSDFIETREQNEVVYSPYQPFIIKSKVIESKLLTPVEISY